jgi:hypothetical protein
MRAPEHARSRSPMASDLMAEGSEAIPISFYNYRSARTAARMRDRIARIGYVNGYPLWSDSEDQALRRTYPDYTAIRRELPDRTFFAIKERVRQLAIQKRYHTWTGADLVKLRRLYPIATKQELLAAFPGPGFSAIEKMAHVKNIRKNRRWL